MTDDNSRYPIGRFQYIESPAPERDRCLKEFREAPATLRNAVDGLTDKQLLTPYREDGWTVAPLLQYSGDKG